MEKSREDRLEALRAEDEQESERAGGGDTWGGSDEEVGVGPRFLFLWTDFTIFAVAFTQLDDAQAAFMRKTAAHILSSPNPAVLELRILANHGADPRFAFLRGRWSRSWDSIKAQASAEAEKARAPALGVMAPSGLGGLADYGGSEDEDEEADTTLLEVRRGGSSDEAVKAARRERAKEWARKRRDLES